jgi:hypothetical protein
VEHPFFLFAHSSAFSKGGIDEITESAEPGSFGEKGSCSGWMSSTVSSRREVLPAILQDGLLEEENIGNCMMIVQEIAR